MTHSRHPSQDSNQQIPPRSSVTTHTENLLQALLDNSFDLAGLLDEQFNYLYISDSVNRIFNNKADSLFGYDAHQLLGKNCLDLIHPEDQERMAEQLNGLLNGIKKVQTRPYRIRNAQGQWLWLEAIITNHLHNPSIGAIVVSAREITQLMETEARLKEMQIWKAWMEGEEKARDQIAQNLHDEVLGMMAAIKFHLSLADEIADGKRWTPAYRQGMKLLEETTTLIRKIAHNMMPAIVLENGLGPALERYCQNLSTNKLVLHFISVGKRQRFSPHFELALYRVAQELISNLLRHACASEGIVQLSQFENRLLLTIEDNGKGFTINESTQGTGLASVQKRVQAMNGVMEIDSKPNAGTTIQLVFDT